MRVDGEPLEPLTSRRVDYYSARIVGTPPQNGGSAAPVSVRRDRFVSEGTHLVRRLMRDDMFSGWGIRTMSTEDAGYNPLEYHNGTVWPHDTAIAAEGMRRYGFTEEAAKLCEALLDAARALTNQLPEVFAGFARDETDMPIEYPDALKPQSWAAAAPLLAFRTVLGLDAVDGRLRSRPMKTKYGKLRLKEVEVRGGRVDVP